MERIFLKAKLTKIITAQKDWRSFKASNVSNNYEVIILWKKLMNSFYIGFCSETAYICIISIFLKESGASHCNTVSIF